jgi:hypothetical protein
LKLNLIVGKRKQRVPKLLEELGRQGVTDFEFWPAIYLHSVKAGVNAAHKQIVEYAKLAGWPEVCIAEDDLQFTSDKSLEYFLAHKPDDYHLYLSMIYLGEPGEDNTVEEFTGMTLYMVHGSFYDTFLSADPNEHIDRALAGLGKFVVCKPFVAKQYNGISANTGKWEEYDHLLKNREFL